MPLLGNFTGVPLFYSDHIVVDGPYKARPRPRPGFGRRLHRWKPGRRVSKKEPGIYRLHDRIYAHPKFKDQIERAINAAPR